MQMDLEVAQTSQDSFPASDIVRFAQSENPEFRYHYGR